MAGSLGSAPLLTVAAPRRPRPRIPAPGDRHPGAGAAEAAGHCPGLRARPGGLARLVGKARAERKGAVGERRKASAPRPHLGHHFLELALRPRHGGRFATPVPTGRGSAAPGLPQAAPHSRTPQSQPPTPPPLPTGSRPPRQRFRFPYVTSEVGDQGWARLELGRPSNLVQFCALLFKWPVFLH